jgi:hypothetical protein
MNASILSRPRLGTKRRKHLSATDSGNGLAEHRPPGGFPRDSQADYHDVRRRIRGLAGCLLDRESTVVVVSKGDQELLGFESSQGWHFPRTADGNYAGHHPGDAAEAVAHLEELRGEGADYFLLPSTYFWWLDHYEALARHLGSRYRLVADCPDTCLIYDLRAGPVARRAAAAAPRAGAEPRNGEAAQNPLVPAIRTLLDSLLPEREPVLVVSGGHDDLLRLGRVTLHFPHDSQGGYRSIGSIGQAEITAQLAAARESGIRYLVLPATVWAGAAGIGALRGPLREYAREVAIRAGICAIYELERRTAPALA